jgi:hypothetical protein
MMKEKEDKIVVEQLRDENDLSKGKITNCPTCGVDLLGSKSCVYITCPCAPRITV